MNQEEFLLKQAERQNQLIDRLLKENTCLSAIITAFLLPGKELSGTEKDLIRLMVGNIGIYSFHDDSEDRKSKNNSFHDTSGDGNRKYNSFHSNSADGNRKLNSFHSNSEDGNNLRNTLLRNAAGRNNETRSGNIDAVIGVDRSRLPDVMKRITPLMKTAPQKTILNTAFLLLRWQANPATAPAVLRKHTGLSAGGMAKRVMAIKKAGLIIRYNHPLRYVLTEKAEELVK